MIWKKHLVLLFDKLVARILLFINRAFDFSYFESNSTNFHDIIFAKFVGWKFESRCLTSFHNVP